MGRSVRRIYRPPMYRMIEILLQRVCEFIDRSYKKSQSVHMLADGLLRKKEATEWLKDNLLLTLHQDKFYLQEVTKGIKFIGGVIKPGRVYTSNSTVGGLYNRLYDLEHLCTKIANNHYTFKDLKQLENMANSVNSYMGFLVHNNSYALKRKLFGSLKYFWKCCFIYRKYSVVCIRKKYRYKLRLFKQINKHELELCKYGSRIAC